MLILVGIRRCLFDEMNFSRARVRFGWYFGEVIVVVVVVAENTFAN